MRAWIASALVAGVLLGCDRPNSPVIPRGPARQVPLPEDHEFMVLFEQTRQQMSHPKEDLLKSTLQSLAHAVYGRGRLEWIDDRMLSLEQPQGWRQGPEDLKAWKAFAPRTAFAAKYDFSGDFARVLWVEGQPPRPEAFFLFLVFREDQWMVLAPALLRGNGDSWKSFYTRHSRRMEIGRTHFERQSKGSVTYPNGYTDDELLFLIHRVEELSRKDGKCPAGLWF